MKVFRILFCAVVLAAMGAAMCQSRPGNVIVDVPFAFNVAGQQLPAGHYIVAGHGDLVRIFTTTKQDLFVSTHAAVRVGSSGSKLVFHRYGDTYFLSEIWVSGDRTGKELFRSRAERELAARQAEMELAEVRPAQ